MIERIKGLRKKHNSVFDPLIPFGTDGILVDMLSGLDNEQEIKLGGNHISDITETTNLNNETVTNITEVYKDKTNTNIIYTVVNEITEHLDGSTTIVSSIYQGSNVTVAALNIKTITIPASEGTNLTIEEVLS